MKGLLAEANVSLSHNFEAEYSHHYGIKKFNQVGVVIITVINRQYCKKFLSNYLINHILRIITIKRRNISNSAWFFKSRSYGKKLLLPGDTCLVQPGIWHSFSTSEGCVFEEISTTHYNNDSVYKDKKINEM